MVFSRTRLLITILATFASQYLSAESAVQSNWSLGPGTWGPLSDWGAYFFAETEVDWLSATGVITLEGMPGSSTVDETFDGARYVIAADLDGDDDLDIVGAARYADEIAWWENTNGSGISWSKSLVATDFDDVYAVSADDVDGDGDIDILGAAILEQDITWWENLTGSGTSWAEHTIDGEFNGAMSVYSEDIDGDGDVDVLGAGGSNISWWENTDGSGESWIEHSVDSELQAAWSVFSDDIDSDDHLDVIGASFGTDEIIWWENRNGSGSSWKEHVIDSCFDGPESVFSGDIDGDGDTDVLGAAHYDGDIAWWENTDGSGSVWSKHVVDGSATGATSVSAADIDGDGDLDVLSTSEDDDDICWHENMDGSGTSWEYHVLSEYFSDVNTACSADLNNDGHLDVLAAAMGADAIVWWNLHGYSTEGSLMSSVLDTGIDPQWDYLSWMAYSPSSTYVYFQVRASDDFNNMGEWSDTLTAPCSLAGILEDGQRYMQYKTILITSCSESAPTLDDVTVSWNSMNIEGGPSEVYELIGPVVNPSCSTANIQFLIPEANNVDFRVFDCSGRVVGIVSDGFPEGLNTVTFSELRPGIYFIEMSTEDFREVECFALIE